MKLIIFKQFFNLKNIIFSFLTTFFIMSILFSVVNLPTLSYGVINFSTIFILFFIWFNVFKKMEFFKLLNTWHNSLLIFIFGLLYIYIFQIFIIFILALFQSFWQINSIFLFDSIPEVNWLEVNYLPLIYEIFITSVIIFLATIILKEAPFKILLIFAFLIIINLFLGGYFITYIMDKNNLSIWGTKQFVKTFSLISFSGFFKIINPFFWINMFSCTIFFTNDLFVNFNEFHVNFKDIYSFLQIFIPLLFIFFMSIFIYIKKFLKFI